MSSPFPSDEEAEIPPPAFDFDSLRVESQTLRRNKDRPDFAAQLAKAKAVQQRELAAQFENQRIKQGRYRSYASRILLIGLFLCFLALQCQGLFLFARGFLLTRRELLDKSECAAPPADITVGGVGSPGTVEDGCWMPKTFSKAVVIIIDALRYDFVVPEANQAQAKAYQNAIPFLYETALSSPQNAVLRPFIADPPTTTLQRLKGLMTGTLPTFVDAGTNFAGMAISEDSLIGQLSDANKTIVHLGDDTWHALFPGKFDDRMSQPFESFNVWDLHTLDNGVNQHLFPLLERERQKDWDVLIAHYLGVDHAGHRYGPEHPAMTEKLRQMDDVVRRVAATLDEDTLLVVMGDHGMDSKGDHGGESRPELESALWMYSRQRAFGRVGSGADVAIPPTTATDRPLPQVDFVPTFALLLGLPIPYSNLGAPMEEGFVGAEGTDFLRLARARRLASSQVHRYMSQYGSGAGEGNGDLRAAALSPMGSVWAHAERTWQLLQKMEKPKGDDDWRSLVRMHTRYQDMVSRESRARWAQFDVPSMVAGLAVLALTLVVIGIYAFGITGDRTELTGLFLRRIVGGSATGIAIGLATVRMLSAGDGDGDGEGTSGVLNTLLARILLGSAIGGITGFFSALRPSRKQLSFSVPTSPSMLITALLIAGWCASLGSNSYIVWETMTVRFFLATVAAVYGLKSWAQRDRARRLVGLSSSLAFACLGRVISESRFCRDEQFPFCQSNYYPIAAAEVLTSTSAGAATGAGSNAPLTSLLSSSVPTMSLIYAAIPLAVAITLPYILRSHAKVNGVYHGGLVTWLETGMPAALFLAAVFWILDTLDDMGKLPGEPGTIKVGKMVLAQGVLYIVVGMGGMLYKLSKPVVKLVRTEQSVREGGAGTSEKTQKKKKKKKKMSTEGDGQPGRTAWKLHKVEDSRYLMLPLCALPALVVLTKPLGGGVLMCALLQIMCLMEMVAATSPGSDFPRSGPRSPASASASASDSASLSARTVPDSPKHKHDNDHDHGRALSPLPIFALVLIGTSVFYATGHAPVLSSIQWDSAFVPLSRVRYPWSPAFVVLNTFAGPVLAALAVPGIVLWRRAAAAPPTLVVGAGAAPLAITPATISSPPSAPSAPPGPGSVSVTGPHDGYTKLSGKAGVGVGAGAEAEAALTGPATPVGSSAVRTSTPLGDVAAAVSVHLLVSATMLLATAAVAAVLRRHLMLFRVFCPRFIFQAVETVVVGAVVCVTGVAGVREG